MRLRDITKRAGRSLKNAKARTLLTSLAIGVGAFTITLSLAAGTGGKEYASEIISNNVNPKQIMVTKVSEKASGPTEYSDTGESSIDFGDGNKVDTLTENDVKDIQSASGVKTAYPSLGTTPLYITAPTTQKKFQLSSIDVYDSAIERKYAAGNPGKEIGNGAVISDEYQKALGFSSAKDAIGKNIQVAFVKGGSIIPNAERKIFTFSVQGVTEKNDISAAVSAPLLVSQNSLQQMHDYQYSGTPYANNYVYVLANVENADDAAATKKAIEEKGYRAQTAEDLMSFIFQFINVLQGILIGFGALAVLTSVFGIINTQYISVLERTQQIGLMKALGMRRRDVGRLFKLEAAWIGFLGGVIGSGLALAAGTAANPWIREVLSLGENTNLLIFEPWVFAVVIIGLMLVSVGAGILPARKAAKLDPIEALRTE